MYQIQAMFWVEQWLPAWCKGRYPPQPERRTCDPEARERYRGGLPPPEH